MPLPEKHDQQSFKAMQQGGLRRHKYNVAPKEERTVDGITFDSKKEMNYYLQLKLLKGTLKIQTFLRQVPIEIEGGKYICDFLVIELDGRYRWIDVKGVRTADYKRKKKQVFVRHGITIEEI